MNHTNTRQYLHTLNKEQLIDLLILVKDDNNYQHKDLLYALNFDHQHYYETCMYLDTSQMKNLEYEIGEVILRKMIKLRE